MKYEEVLKEQIHVPDANYMWPADSYVVIDEKKQELKIE
jgi:hypothetical protein